MKEETSQTQARRPCVKPSKALQETLPAAIQNPSADLPRSLEYQSLAVGGSPRGALLRSKKRALDAALDVDPAFQIKRARLAPTDAQQPRLEDETSEQADKAILHQPKPRPSKCSYASFFSDFVDPTHLDSRSAPVHGYVSEWLESVGPGREKRCRSDTHLIHPHSDPIPRKLTRSTPDEGSTKDVDGFMPLLTPASIRPWSRPSTSDGSNHQSSATDALSESTGPNIREGRYRSSNLASNRVYFRPSTSPLPEIISSHMETIHTERDSPGLSYDEMNKAKSRLEGLSIGSCDENELESFLIDTIFPTRFGDLVDRYRTAGLKSSSKGFISAHLVPANPAYPPRVRIAQPKPDKLYGYSGGGMDSAFTTEQHVTESMLHPEISDYPVATSWGIIFPFLTVEFKATGGTRGDLWVAANQCAGAASACLNASGILNVLLQDFGSKHRVDNVSHSIAVDKNLAQVYISWKEDGERFYVQRVGNFLLSEAEHFKKFRSHVRNIFDWGVGTRLAQIKEALDIIQEQKDKREAAEYTIE
ncbi:hypothetical protein F5Y10DRAFT_267756 [Nemania abortiva]|nr:hypothetical protein F5Y10DRAFT_267756 [Nemania abortiva]